MQPLPPGVTLDLRSDEQAIWLCTAFARDLCTLARECPRDRLEVELHAHVGRYGDLVTCDMQQLRALIARSVETASCYTAAAELRPVETALLDGLQLLSQPSPGMGENSLDGAPDAAGGFLPAAFARRGVADHSLDTIVLADLQPRVTARSTLPSRQH
jgi:hypothetical protein